MRCGKRIPAIALGVVSLTAPLAAAGTGSAAAASDVTVTRSSQVEEAALTDSDGKPSGVLSATTSKTSKTSKTAKTAKTATASKGRADGAAGADGSAPAVKAAGAAAPLAGKVFSTGRITGEHFSSIGLSWKKESAVDSGLTAQTRIHRNGAWGSWRNVPLELGEGVAEEAKRAGSPAFYTQDADGAEVRLTSPGGSLPQDLRLAFIDPGKSPAVSPAKAVSQAEAVFPAKDVSPAKGESRSVPAGRSAQPAQPVVKLRKDWGADESLSDPGYKTQPSLKAALVHHTVTGNNSYTQAQVPQIINGIYVQHIVSLGYGDFPYHFVVDRFGGIWEGRKGSIEMKPGTSVPGILGGHASGFNTNTFGVAALGNFEPNNSEGGEDTGPDPEPSAAMAKSLADLLAWKIGQYQLNPEGSTQLVSAGGGGTNPYPAGKVLDVPVISSHRDVNVTACPGGKLYELLPSLRQQVADRIG